MQRLVALAQRNPLVAGGMGVAAVVIVGLVFAIQVVASGGQSSAALEVEPTPVPTATNTPSPTATRTPTRTPSPTSTPSAYAGILDGMFMTEEEWTSRKDLLPLAIMFDNTPDSQPQSGLSKADLVYETFVEGGITRLMAVFWRQEAEVILPVRSARTPFVIWVSELDAMYGHAGSAVTVDAANAFGQLIEWNIKDLDAFDAIANRAYYRTSDRYAPYNLATSTQRLRDSATQKGYSGPPTTQSWKFIYPGEQPKAGQPAGGIEVDFGGRRTGWQLIHWKWDDSAKAYARSMFGGAQNDGTTGEQLKFTTVIVMTVPGGVYNSNGHYLLEQFGEGEATIFMRGQAYEARWKKDDRLSRTRFYTPEGEEIALERGPIFIEAIGLQSKLTYVASAASLAPLPAYTPPPPAPGPINPGEDFPVGTPTPTAEPTAEPTEAPTVQVTPTPQPTVETPEPEPTATPRVSPTPLVLETD